MDNYLRSILFEGLVADEAIKAKIRQFNSQYLIKLANMGWDEAALFQRDTSPWAARSSGDYHRSYYEGNLLLSTIQAEIASRVGVAKEKVILVSDQPLLNDFCSYIKEHLGRKILVIEDPSKIQKIHQIIRERGFAPSLQEAAAMASSLDLIQANPTFHFPEKIPGITSFSQFINHPMFSSFRNFARSSFSSSVVIDLLEGFSQMDLDPFFDQKRVSQLLHSSYGRILHYFNQIMRQPVVAYRDLQRVENFQELIYEEMIFWLMMREPYLESQLEDKIQNLITQPAFFRTVQSGMAAFSEIIKILVQNESIIFYYDDCYFESIASIQGAHSRAICFPDYEASLNSQLAALGDQRIDLLFVDFHNNFVSGKFQSDGHNIFEILKKVLPFASHSFTLVIDNTIGYLDSTEIREVLDGFPTLNVVVVWSHKKFDLFGTDKFTAGSYCLYSQDLKLIERFQKIKGGEIDWVSRQGLSHFFTFGAKKMEERRRRIFDNARYVNDRIDPKIPYVVKKSDSICYSVDLQPGFGTDRKGLLVEKFERWGIPLMTRLSFGYNLTTASFLREQMLRFSIGVEERKYLNQFIRAFNAIFAVEPVTSEGVGVPVDVNLNGA